MAVSEVDMKLQSNEVYGYFHQIVLSDDSKSDGVSGVGDGGTGGSEVGSGGSGGGGEVGRGGDGGGGGVGDGDGGVDGSLFWCGRG
uniref:Uncharacterized protein n=1 Tax=Oryza rufipogon TaxID=4529 RepID=A0A0E0QHJ7_ORYRU